MGLVVPGWHGVGSRDRAGGPGFSSTRSSFRRNEGFPLHHVDLTLIGIKISAFYESRGVYSEIRLDMLCTL